ncbi:DUF2529 family protein [Ureibacillus sinduriensis]|uniref:DUF2529 domain-containing protein n=1 Tax=Ureibacillus sinduriensis BLB-1 = JCM 15800 TaxID=1384057 RepID=A0A0A3HZZ4_9BACL|nr:DUF2529 family protein [Ureibacillus sinduriensis]KGR75953.1 hypothetical protein CD33_08935 [Ureibacillus sinduriensis BLB-1 = JCM 15800]
MSKILSTQMSGLFQRIIQSEEEAIEETSRLLAQASIGQGNIYFACFDELQAIETNALHGAEPFINLKSWSTTTPLTEADRVCIFTTKNENPEALNLAKKLYENFIPFSVVSNEPKSESNELSELAYTYISMKVRGGILPHPTKLGERVLIPNLMAGLFIYEAIKLNYDEMISDDDEL